MSGISTKEATMQANEVEKQKEALHKQAERTEQLIAEVEAKKTAKQGILNKTNAVWTCQNDPTQKGEILAQQELHCDGTAWFSARTEGDTLTASCNLEFRAESARRYGAELLRFADKVRKCSSILSPAGILLQPGREMEAAVGGRGKSEGHVKAKALLKLVKKASQKIDRFIRQQVSLVYQSGAGNGTQLLAPALKLASSSRMDLLSATQKVKQADQQSSSLQRARETQQQTAIGITSDAPADSVWLCNTDPHQNGTIMALVGSKTCDSAVTFMTSSTSLEPDCKRQFLADSAELYGKAQLQLSEVLKNHCPENKDVKPVNFVLKDRSEALLAALQEVNGHDAETDERLELELRNRADFLSFEQARFKEMTEMAQQAIEVSHKPIIRKQRQEKYKKMIEQRLAAKLYRVEELAKKKAMKREFEQKLDAGKLRISFMEVLDARIDVIGSTRNATLEELSSAKCKDYCSRAWWCQVVNYDRKKSWCTMLQKTVQMSDIIMGELEHDVFIRTTSERALELREDEDQMHSRWLGEYSLVEEEELTFSEKEDMSAMMLMKKIKEGKAAEAILKVALEKGVWECPHDASQYGSVKVSAGSCTANMGFASGTAKPLTTQCDMLFKGITAQVYGGALVKYAQMLRGCPKVDPPPKMVVRVTEEAEKVDEKAASESEAVIAVKQSLVDADTLLVQMKENNLVTETEESAAKSPEEKDVLTFIKQGHNTAIQAIETAMSVRAAVVNAKELEKKRVEANARIAAKEQRAKDDAKWNWFCPADPVQRGAIKATFMDCDAAVAFGSGTKGQLQVSTQLCVDADYKRQCPCCANAILLLYFAVQRSDFILLLLSRW